MIRTTEHARIEENVGTPPPWSRWGPYVSERAWGTVREDYSADGDAWRYFPHDHARSKAYRWGDDGLAGICDRYQWLIFAVALWNGHDPILKERAFGLTLWEGNHGEDVKEYYFYLDNTPTHSFMRYLYKYPQAAYPYGPLLDENNRRNGGGSEFELLDAGAFADNRYFDVDVRYAKASPTDICIWIGVTNRGPDTAALHLLPHLWFRNTWSWRDSVERPRPRIRIHGKQSEYVTLLADSSMLEPMANLLFPYRLPNYYLYADGNGEPWFTENETNFERLYGHRPAGASVFCKDAFHRHLIGGESCLNPEQIGSKSCLHYRYAIAPGQRVVTRLRLTEQTLEQPFAGFDGILEQRRQEADEFYQALCPKHANDHERQVQRQAFANLLWSKQLYLFNVNNWLDGDAKQHPPPPGHQNIRNQHWRHLNSKRILIMPDKWEYPWFAAWDLAFACVPMAIIDPSYAKEQLWLMLFEQFQHPNGQIPAYEWDFSDLNPPVHAWAVWRVFNMEKHRYKRADVDFLERCFHKLLLNFTWWVNKVDSQGHNIFEGGFLGLDNISVVDRSVALPNGSSLKQSDATGWMAMYCLNMMRISLELAKSNAAYEHLATKFLEHYIYIGSAMKNMGGQQYQLWDDTDGFFYDVLQHADQSYDKFRVRSLVGLIPMFAVERLQAASVKPFPTFAANLNWFLRNRNQFTQFCCHPLPRRGHEDYLLSIPDPQQIRRILTRVFDSQEFLAPFGMRSLSKVHADAPFQYGRGQVRFEPAEAETKIKGGNSNWRGPVWFPVGFLMIESLRKLHYALGSDFTLEIALDGRPRQMNLLAMAQELADRMIALFLPDRSGRRPVFGDESCFRDDPHWRDLILFHEYFHAESGKGLGASHQTWTLLVATLLDEWRG